MKKLPKVTILLPVYNAEKYVSQAIDSILKQTFEDFELLIINDGSTDESEEIIFSFKDPRIRYLKNTQNRKLVDTLNKGIESARGEYIARMDADDISLPARLQKQVSFLDNNPLVGVCGTWYQNFGVRNNVVKTPVDDTSIKTFLFFNSPFCHPTVVFRKELLLRHNLKYDNILYAEDYMLWVKLSRLTEMANMPEVLLLYREHEKNISSTNRPNQVRNANVIRSVYLEQEFGNKFSKSVYSEFCSLNSDTADLIIGRDTFNEMLLLFRSLYKRIFNDHNLNRSSKKQLISDFNKLFYRTGYLGIRRHLKASSSKIYYFSFRMRIKQLIK